MRTVASTPRLGEALVLIGSIAGLVGFVMPWGRSVTTSLMITGYSIATQDGGAAVWATAIAFALALTLVCVLRSTRRSNLGIPMAIAGVCAVLIPVIDQIVRVHAKDVVGTASDLWMKYGINGGFLLCLVCGTTIAIGGFLIAAEEAGREKSVSVFEASSGAGWPVFFTYGVVFMAAFAQTGALYWRTFDRTNEVPPSVYAWIAAGVCALLLAWAPVQAAARAIGILVLLLTSIGAVLLTGNTKTAMITGAILFGAGAAAAIPIALHASAVSLGERERILTAGILAGGEYVLLITASYLYSAAYSGSSRSSWDPQSTAGVIGLVTCTLFYLMTARRPLPRLRDDGSNGGGWLTIGLLAAAMLGVSILEDGWSILTFPFLSEQRHMESSSISVSFASRSAMAILGAGCAIGVAIYASVRFGSTRRVLSIGMLAGAVTALIGSGLLFIGAPVAAVAGMALVRFGSIAMMAMVFAKALIEVPAPRIWLMGSLLVAIDYLVRFGDGYGWPKWKEAVQYAPWICMAGAVIGVAATAFTVFFHEARPRAATPAYAGWTPPADARL